MDGSEDKQWGKRLSWANCREPYKTELDALASLWVVGQLTNGELALELWEMWSKKRFVESDTKTLSGVRLLDVEGQMEILVEAMRSSALYSTTSSEDRRELLENSRSIFGKNEGQHR